MVYLIVPTYGRIKETKKFLDSLQQCINKNYLIIIIDDHPEKLTSKSIEQNSNLIILTSKKELWWVGSINLGIKTLFNNYYLEENDIVVFANNDIEIDKKSFEILCYEINKNKDQILHPRTINQDGLEVSSGTKVVTFFPYITRHPKNFKNEKEIIDMGTARFLMMSGSVLRKVGYINKKLVQYGGDNDFTLSAKRFHNINTYLIRDSVCKLDDTFTGIKNQNIKTFRELYKSFFSITSPNNIKFRYLLIKKFFGNIAAFFIALSMSINAFIKFFLRNRSERT